MIFISESVERALEETRAKTRARQLLEADKQLDRTYYEIAMLMNSFSEESLSSNRPWRRAFSRFRRSKRG